jgi:putative endonuclease
MGFFSARGWTTKELGRRGESRAVWYYRLRGYSILGRNIRDRDGEIDLVARRGRTVVFVEVKTRRSVAAGEPWEAVGERKREQMVRAAQRYLARERLGTITARFDVVSIVWTGWRFRVDCYRDALMMMAENGRPWRERVVGNR